MNEQVSLLRHNLIIFFNQSKHYTYWLNSLFDRRLRFYVWLLHDIYLEGEIGEITKDIFSILFQQYPSLSQETIQLLIRAYFQSLTFRLFFMGYFEPRDNATPVILRRALETYVNPRMEWLFENSLDVNLLTREVEMGFISFLQAVENKQFQERIIFPRLTNDVQRYYRDRQEFLNHLFYPLHEPDTSPLEPGSWLYNAMQNDYVESENINRHEVLTYINNVFR